MANFPTALKPIVNQGYSFDASKNVLSQQVQGGSPLQMLDYKYSPVLFNVSLVLNPLELQVFQDWYYGSVNSGADKFSMMLDSGLGIESHIVHILPESVSFDGARLPIMGVTFQIQAEKIPAQDVPFGGGLADLYDVYGDELPALLDALDIFALEVLPL